MNWPGAVVVVAVPFAITGMVCLAMVLDHKRKGGAS
jgi:hypothetical protein